MLVHRMISSGRLRQPRRSERRGIAVFWLIAAIPAFLVLVAFLVDIGNLWLARAELENGLEAAALAAVKEWGDSGGASGSLTARQVGVAYAAANRVRGMRLELVTNYDPNPNPNNPNENLTCCVTPSDPCGGNDPTGSLIFGAITEDDPNCPVTFNAGVAPGCGLATILIDATAQGPGNLGQDNAWGISLRPTANTPPGLTIESVTIDLQVGGGTGRFDFTGGGPVVSDSSPAPAVPCQPDVAGLDPATQVTFSPNTGTPSSLTISFNAAGADAGFEPGDRIRFGARTIGVSSGSGQDDGDGIGRDGVRVTVVFAIGGVPQPPVSAVFLDNTDSSNDCLSCSCPTPCVPHPSGIPDLPCPPASAPNNNGQSYVYMQGGGARRFAVRAQAVVKLRSPLSMLGGPDCGLHCISARATAVYDCASHRATLIRVDRFICPGPNP